MAGDSTTIPRGRFALASIGALAGSLTLLVTLLASGEAAAAPSGGIKAENNCGVQPAGLSPDGSGPVRFTMLIRINQQVNVDDWVNFDTATGGLGARVRPQDIFVINTRHENSDPALAAQLATNLRTAFPCNRIIALNGLGLNPTVAGYAFTLADLVADNASAARLVLGGVRQAVDGIDLRLVGCVLELGGQVRATAAGAASLGHPAAAVAWLVRALHRRGRGLAAGDVVLSGGLTEAVPVAPGDVVVARLGRLGTVELAVR